MKETLQNYYNACEQVRVVFEQKYFGVKEDIESWWVGDDVGGVLYINDHFFNLSTMIDFLRHRYSQKMMFDYYEYALEEQSAKRLPINIKNWRQLRK